MEICCANCEDGPCASKCSFSPNCLNVSDGFNKRGRYHFYYNHFKPKEDKVAWTKIYNCKACGKSLAEGEMCKCKDKVEYKHTGKSLTAREVIANGNTTRAQTENFAEWMAGKAFMDDDLFYVSVFLPYALKIICFKKYLIEGKYIEPVDTWESPKIGDRFEHKKHEFLLCGTISRDEVGLFCTGDYAGDKGKAWIAPIRVENLNKITKEEWKVICGLIPIDELERI